MALVFARKMSRRSTSQASLWDPTVVGRSFANAAMTFRSGEEALRERLRELDLRRRRAQIQARRAVEGREPSPAGARPAALPFAS